MSKRLGARLAGLLSERFADPPGVPRPTRNLGTLARFARHASCRAFLDRPVDHELVRLLAALALASPTKSDLQQRDIVIVDDPKLRRALDALLVEGQPWIASAPLFLLFCGNNARQRALHRWRGHRFANDHLDAFFNAAVDAAIALQAFVSAAEAAGLGCCPVSAVRNRAREVSDLVGLPHHVFPVAGLALGWPKAKAKISLRLPLALTVHRNRFEESDTERLVEEYDRQRAARQPYAKQRDVATFGESADYGWSEDKARQYARPERADFAAYVRAQGFRLE